MGFFEIKIRAIQERLRVKCGSCAGDLFEISAFFTGDADVFACGFHEEVAFVLTAAMDVMFLGKIAENEDDQIADVLVSIKIIAVCVLNMGKLGIVDDIGKLFIGHFHSLHHSALGADEQNIDVRVRAGECEKLTGGEKLSGDHVSVRGRAENAGNGQTDLFVLHVFQGKLGTATLTFELDDVTRKRQRADNTENSGAAMGATICKGRIFGL